MIAISDAHIPYSNNLGSFYVKYIRPRDPNAYEISVRRMTWAVTGTYY